MTKSKRTHPLDRDGDGKPGGSLPGNQTAPMADRDTATQPISGANVQPSAHVRAEDADFVEPSWTRDNAAILLKLAETGIEIDTTKPAALAEETLADWTNEDAHAAELFADKMTAEGAHMDEEGGQWLDADLHPIAIPAVLERYLFRNVEQDDLADVRTTPGDSAEKLEAIEREVDHANGKTPPYVVTVRVNPRDAGEPLTFGVDTNIPGLVVDADTLAEASDLALALAKELLTDAGASTDAIDHIQFRISPEAEAAEKDRAANAAAPDGHGDTFDAEQVAAARQAGEGAVVGEEGETVAEPSAAAATLDGGLVTIPTDTAPVAVRLHELRILVGARRLYKSPQGYSSNYGAPYIDQPTIDAWIAAGLAEDVPSAGNMGGVRVTAEARSVLNRAPTDEAA